MTAEQLAAFRAIVAKTVCYALRLPALATFSPEIERVRAAFGIDPFGPPETHNQLIAAEKRRAITELQRRGFRPNEARARAVARRYVQDHVEWGHGDRLASFVGGGTSTYAYSVLNGRANCRIHNTWEERPGFILVHELYLQPCCYHFPIEELRAEIEGNRVVQLSLGMAA